MTIREPPTSVDVFHRGRMEGLLRFVDVLDEAQAAPPTPR